MITLWELSEKHLVIYSTNANK